MADRISLAQEGLLPASVEELEVKLDSQEYLSLLLKKSGLGEDTLDQVAEVADIHGITPRVLVEDELPLHDLASSLFVFEHEAADLVQHCKSVVAQVRETLDEKEAERLLPGSCAEAQGAVDSRGSQDSEPTNERLLSRSPEPPSLMQEPNVAPTFIDARNLGFEQALQQEPVTQISSEKTTFIFSGSMDVAHNEGMGDSCEVLPEGIVSRQARRMYFGNDTKPSRRQYHENIATQETTCATDPSNHSSDKSDSEASVASQMSTNQRENARSSAMWNGTPEATANPFAGFEGASSPVLPYEILPPSEEPLGNNSPEARVAPIQTHMRSPSPRPNQSGAASPPDEIGSPTGPEFARWASPAPRNVNFGETNGSSGWLDPPMVGYARFRSVEPRSTNVRIDTFRHASVPPRFQTVHEPSYLRPTAASEARRRAIEESRESLRRKQTPPARNWPHQTRRRSRGPSASLMRPTQSSLARQQATNTNVDGSHQGRHCFEERHHNSIEDEDNHQASVAPRQSPGPPIENPQDGHQWDHLSTLDE